MIMMVMKQPTLRQSIKITISGIKSNTLCYQAIKYNAKQIDFSDGRHSNHRNAWTRGELDKIEQK